MAVKWTLRGRIPPHQSPRDDAGMPPVRYPLVTLATHETLKAGARNAVSSHQRRYQLRRNAGDAGAVRLPVSVGVRRFFAVPPPFFEEYENVINLHACYDVAISFVANKYHFDRLINLRIFQP